MAVLEAPGHSLDLEAEGHLRRTIAAATGRRIFARDDERSGEIEEDFLRRQLDTEYLRRLQNVIRRLRKLHAIPPSQFREDEDAQWLAARNLHLGCQIVLDIGSHLLSGAFARTAETYEQILSGLGREGVLASALMEEVGGVCRFRNILVHAYLDLDPARVWEVLQRGPDRFERFARSLTPARRTTSSFRCLR